MSSAATRSEAHRARERLALVLACALLTFFVFRQAPGLATTDTKLDLVVDPWEFLRRGAVFWNPLVDGGVVQNQAYGYLFPMGPTFGVLHSIGMPAWVAQRVWESLLVCVAFLATTRVARELGVRGFVPQIAAGFTYALAPRMISELTTISSELLPMVALPLMMIPLVRASRGGSPRRGAVLAGAAFALTGGINAAASVAILPAAGLWLLTRARSARRGVLIRWFALAIVLASTWWIVPLLVLGRYSPPFLDWIEGANITTAPLSLFNTARGSSQWVSYLGADTWPGGWAIATLPAVIAATVAVLGLGLWGLSHRTAPHRRYLLSLLLIGLLILSFGHVSSYGPAWMNWTQGLLDGPLAPFRNIHKFEPLVRLPVAIGVGYALARLYLLAKHRWKADPLAGRRTRQLITFAMLCLSAVYAAPIITNTSAVNARESATTLWWEETGRWLDEHAGGDRALVVPGSPSPTFLWGRTADEPLQPSTASPWTVRSGVPLTPAGYIRFLDLIEQHLANGVATPGLPALLSDAGIGFIVLRNDLNAYASLATPTEVVRATLEATPGFERETAFGPDTTFPLDDNNLTNGGLSTPRPAIEIWSVSPTPSTVTMVPASQVVTANGSSDNLTPALTDQIGPNAPVVFDPPQYLKADAGPDLLTDGIRKQQAFFGASAGKSKTLTAQAPYLGSRQAYDYLPPGAEVAAYEYRGVTDVYATSSGDSIYAQSNAGALNGPWSAIDGTPLTAWYSASPFGALGESLRVEFEQPWSSDHFTIQFPADMLAYPTSLDVTTDAGTTRVGVQPTDEPQVVTLDIPETTFLTVQAAALDRADATGTNFAISDLVMPGVIPQRFLVIPGEHTASHVHFERSPGARPQCRTVDETTYCDDAAVRFSEEQFAFAREFTLRAGGPVHASVSVSLEGTEALDSLLTSSATPVVTTSGTVAGDPRVRGYGALDDDPVTYWQAEAGDSRPWIDIEYPEPFTTDGLQLTVAQSDPLPQPETVRIRAGSFTWTGQLPEDGQVEFGQEITTSSVRVEIISASLRNSTSSFDLRTSILPAGISDLQINGAPEPTALPETIVIPCGGGPALALNGTVVQTEISAPLDDLLHGRAVTATTCGDSSLTLAPGRNQLQVSGTASATPLAVDLWPEGEPLGSTAAEASHPQVTSWTATERTIEVDADADSLLIIRENANEGWHASIDGDRLEAVTVNGWQQAYLVPAGTSGTVALSFEPAGTVRAGLLAGGLMLLVLGGLCLVPFRRHADLPATAEAPWGRVAEVALHVGIVIAGYHLVGIAGLLAGAVLSVCWPWIVARWKSTSLALAPGILLAVATALVIFPDRAGILTRDRGLIPSLLTYAALAVCFLLAAAPARRPDR